MDKKLIASLITIVVLIIINIALWNIGTKHRGQITSLESNISVLTEGIQLTTNKLGQSVAKVGVLETTTSKQLKTIAGLSSDIDSLIEVINLYKSENKKLESLLIFESNVDKDIVTPTVPDTTSTLPIYNFTFIDDWTHIIGVSSMDSTLLSLQIRNKYSIATYYDRKGYQIEITDHNPHSITDRVTAWRITPIKPKRFGIGAQVGTTFLPSKGFKPYPYLGIGLSYNFITF